MSETTDRMRAAAGAARAAEHHWPADNLMEAAYIIEKQQDRIEQLEATLVAVQGGEAHPEVTADLLISELDAMEAVDREWEDNDVSDLDLDAIERLIVDRSHPGRTHYEGCHRVHVTCAAHLLLSEVAMLRERVATLEEGIEAHRRWARQRDASGWMHKGTPHQAPNERLWSLLDAHDQERDE